MCPEFTRNLTVGCEIEGSYLPGKTSYHKQKDSVEEIMLASLAR